MHVPYRGAAPAVNDLLGQQVQMAFLDLPVLLPHIKAGTLRPIALGAPKRAPTSPDVPTTAEVGMPDLLIENWVRHDRAGRTPEPIVTTLNRLANEAMNDPQVKQKLADQGLTVAGDTPAHFRDYIGDRDPKRWARVIKAAGLPWANDRPASLSGIKRRPRISPNGIMMWVRNASRSLARGTSALHARQADGRSISSSKYR